MYTITSINSMDNSAENSSATAAEIIRTYEELITLINLYPVFTGVVFLIYFLIFTYILTLIHKGFYE